MNYKSKFQAYSAVAVVQLVQTSSSFNKKMKDNIVLDKSFEFAIRVVNLYKHLCHSKKEYTLSKQLLRSGTSIGANINEAQGELSLGKRGCPGVQAAQSKKDFIAKMAIASKEARESKYWIDLLIKTDYLNSNDNHTKSLLNEIEEIIKLLTSIVKTGQNKQ